VNPLRSVRVRLALGLFLAVAGALTIVYLILIPSLQHRLTNSKIARLERIVDPVSASLAQQKTTSLWQGTATSESQTLDVRVVVFHVNRIAGRASISSYVDSNTGRVGDDVENDPVALEAATTFESRKGTVGRSGTRFAEVAVPMGTDYVLMLSASLRDSLGTIDLVKRRLLEGGLIALLVALAVAYGTASLFARRIRRLERAADRISRGRFDEPVVDAGGDELGELASAFERMRLRLGDLDNARREFIANASHELRTPIFSLSGFLELLDEEDLDPATQREFMGTMREQVARLTHLATDLLDLSRLDAGRLHVERSSVDLAAVARELGAEFGPLALHDGRALEVDADGDAVATADEQRVEQIGRILVENALVHTRPGTRIVVRARSDRGRARLSVADDGPGIPPDRAEHIFERFYRVDGAVASGSGLGLAIARDLAALMGGEIELESAPGRTVFTLALPGESLQRRHESVFTGKQTR
jgi:two-component system, OmpR family, sensor kinase